MQADFWLEKWTQPKQGWVQEKVNSRLVRYWPQLGLQPSANVLVPLCGDSIDLDFLVSAGYRVCGAELSKSAIVGWAERHSLQLEETGTVGQDNSVSHFSLKAEASNGLVHLKPDQLRSAQQNNLPVQPQLAPHFICGDFLKLRVTDLPYAPAAVYDRAALIALPPDMRKLYAAKLAELLQAGSKILLITLAYDQAQMKGPPFSVQDDEVENLFKVAFNIERIGSSAGPEIVGNLSERGLDTASESVFLLTRNTG